MASAINTARIQNTSAFKCKDFLLWDYVDDSSICDRLIEFYKNSDGKKLGKTGDGYRPDIKNSTDVGLKLDNNVAQEYLIQLQIIVKKYIEKFPFVNFYGPWTVLEGLSLQHYSPPDQAFKAWHTERSGGSSIDITRHLVFMTYLNDVHDGGETEWYHQGIKLSPRKGLTAIWPVDWTYTHRGIPSKTEHKYIVTGWFSYYPKTENRTAEILTAPIHPSERP